MRVLLFLERVKGVEPSYRPWEGRVLPMNYTRMSLFHYTIELRKIQPNFGSFSTVLKMTIFQWVCCAKYLKIWTY